MTAVYLTKLGDKYVWTGGYDTRDLPKQAGFRWSPEERRWWTTFKDSAARLSQYAGSELKADLESYSANKTKSLNESRAATADIDLPRPDGQEYLPFQKAGIQYALQRKNVLLADEMGLGKFLAVDAPVLAPDGWVRIGDVKIGDRIIGLDGRAHNVTGVFDQGEQDIYAVLFSDGVSIEAGGPHLWSVIDSNGRRRGKPYQVKTTDELSRLLHRRWSVPLVQPVQFPSKDLAIPPYIFGVLLEDGSLTNYDISFVPGDEDVPRAVRSCLPADFDLRRGADYGTSTRWSIALKNNGRRHPWTQYLEKVGLRVTGGNKFIPREYLFGSVDQRWGLLRGLMDTDGTVSSGNRIRFNSASRALSEGVAHLVRSLGGMASIGGDQYNTVHISNLSASPFEARHNHKLTSSYRPKCVRSVAYVGKKNCVCISVDAPDNLYVTDGFTLTHNTVQAIGVINATPDIKKVLVVAPASLKLNWKRELEKWLVRPMSVGVANGGLPDTDVVIVNYDVLKKFQDGLSRDWDLLIADEAHYVKNPDAQRTKLLVGGEKKQDGKYIRIPGIIDRAKRRAFLTGTPILNRPIELWPIVSALAPETFPSFMSFAKRYADAQQGKYGWDFSGAAHLDELQDKLRSTIMVRRLKKDVLTELPAKRRQVVEIEPTGDAKALVARETAVADEHTERLAQYRAAVELAKASESDDEYKVAVAKLRDAVQVAFEDISRERHEVALAKVPQVIEHLKDVLEQQDKVVIFAHHRDVVDALMAAFPGQAVKLTGEDSVEDRQKAVDDFQNKKDVKLFVGSVKAAGVGITLTAASQVIFAELDWVPANITQAEDRLHRIGQQGSVLVQHLVFDGSLDSKMAKTLVDKQEVIDKALDLEPPPATPLAEPETKRISRKALAEFADLSDAEVATVAAALRYLAGVDDGAVRLDEVGFNRIDTMVGQSLATSPTLTQKQARLGAVLVQKYRKQLERAGLEVPGMPVRKVGAAKVEEPVAAPAALVTEAAAPTATQAVTSEKAALTTGVGVAASTVAPEVAVVSSAVEENKPLEVATKPAFELVLEGHDENWRQKTRTIAHNSEHAEFIISFPYDADLVSAVKIVPGVRFNRNTKNWYLAEMVADVSAIKVLIQFVKQQGFVFSGGARNKIKEIVEKAGGTLTVPVLAKSEVVPEKESGAYVVSVGEGYGGMPFQVGQTLRWNHSYPEDLKDKLITVVSASSRYYREDGMSFGVGDEQGYVYSAKVRLATEDEGKSIVAAENRAATARDIRLQLATLRAMIQKHGVRPEGDNSPQGERLFDKQDIYGGGDWFVLGDREIWYVQNNGSDGSNWGANNVSTGGAGGIGWRVPYTRPVADKLESLAKLQQVLKDEGEPADDLLKSAFAELPESVFDRGKPLSSDELHNLEKVRPDESRMQDEMLSNQRTSDVGDEEALGEWLEDPGDLDIQGVDTPSGQPKFVRRRRRATTERSEQVVPQAGQVKL